MTDRLTVLIADDNQTDRMILAAITRREGHDVLEATNGIEAVQAFQSSQPDLILMDAMMPEMDGMEAAREIRRLAGEELVPIIFLTSLQDAASLAQCLESGGDDFLSKPYNRVILQAKIKAFGRMRAMHDALRDNHRQLLVEQAVAKKVYDNVTQAGLTDIEHLRYSLSSRAMFNGDTVLAQRRPDGGIHVLVGDFTGHGLPAAIGAMPLAETFYGMTAKGFELDEVVREINTKLMRVLPVNFFCCAAAAHVDLREKNVRLWMGGVPDCYLYGTDGRITAMASQNLPLGITDQLPFSLSMHEFPMRNGERLFLWSDGIVEAENSVGEMFGEERLRATFEEASSPERIFSDLLGRVDRFMGEQKRSDDLTLVEITMGDPPDPAPELANESSRELTAGVDWEVSFHFPWQMLRQHNPMPLVMHVLSETDALSVYSSQLYTLISELYSNALEHGVLGLDSSLKKTGEGFGQYYRQRQERLDSLDAGWITLTMKQQAQGRGGILTIRLEDSGQGFDFAAWETGDAQSEALSGRGLQLVRQLCSRVEYQGCGNIVEVDFCWPRRRLP